MIKEHLAILLGFVKEFKHTGSAFNSSRWAAEALTTPLRSHKGPKTIVEVGAGTGPVTEKILHDMQDGDRLTIVEINPMLMKVLKDRISKCPSYEDHKDRVRFFEGPVQDLPEDWKYDVIVCALPFLNFDVKVSQEIFDKLHRISAEEAVMTWYEYIGLRDLGKAVSPKERKDRLRQYDQFFDNILNHHEVNRERVWLNILPINIYTMKMAA